MLIIFIKSKSLGGITSHIKELHRELEKYNISWETYELSFKPFSFLKTVIKIRKTIKRIEGKDVIIHFHGYKVLSMIPFLPKEVKKICTIHGFLENTGLRARVSLYNHLTQKDVD